MPKVGGKASFTIRWPKRGPVIPTSSNSLTISLTLNGQPVASTVIPRPSGGQTQTSTTFTGLPIDSLDVAVSAYPTVDGTGVAQAAGSGVLVVSATTTNTTTVSLVSTVATLSPSPTSVAVGAGKTQAVTLSAKDAGGNIVLLSVGTASEPIAWASSATGLATVTGTGPTATVSGVLAGTTSVTASFTVNDTGSVVTATIPVLITPPGIGPYTAVDLGTLGGANTAPSALSSAGAVVGQSDLPSGSPDADHGFLWVNGKLTDLGRLGYQSSVRSIPSVAASVNAGGTVVGSVTDSSHSQQQVFAYTYSNGASTPLTSSQPGAYQVRPSMIHDDGDIVGTVIANPAQSYPTLWRNGVEHTLVINGNQGSALCVNTAGKVLANTNGSSGGACFIWQDGVAPVQVGNGQFVGQWMNDAGVVVGYTTSTSPANQAQMWTNGTATNLGTLGLQSVATCINNHGVVVGNSNLSTSVNHGFVWVNGVMKDINDVISIPGWTIALAISVNDLGQVLCYGVNGSVGHAFLLTPSGGPSDALKGSRLQFSHPKP